MASCSLITKRVTKVFENVDTKRIGGNIAIGSVKEGLNNKIEATNFDPNSVLYLPNLLDTVYGIKLDNAPEALVRSVEKLRLTDDAIYLFDKYSSKAVKKFDLNGKHLVSIGQRGRGPGEYTEATDFYVNDSVVVIYDQFKPGLLYYDLSGNFIRSKQIPFFALAFHIFDDNTYIFHTLNSDNYHLPDILNYSLVWTDSTFAIKHVNAFREKDKYVSFLSKNNMDFFNGELYYHEPFNDTVFRVSPYGDIYYDYIFSFPNNQLPPELLLKKNSAKRLKATSPESTKNYVENSANPIVAKDFLFVPVSVNSRVRNIFYSSKSGNVIVDSGPYESNLPILFSPPFSNILNCNGNIIIGSLDAHYLTDRYELAKRFNELHLLSNELIDFAKDVKETDNLIITFSKLKDF